MLIWYVYMNLLRAGLMVSSAFRTNLRHGQWLERRCSYETKPRIRRRVVVHEQRADLQTMSGAKHALCEYERTAIRILLLVAAANKMWRVMERKHVECLTGAVAVGKCAVKGQSKVEVALQQRHQTRSNG